MRTHRIVSADLRQPSRIDFLELLHQREMEAADGDIEGAGWGASLLLQKRDDAPEPPQRRIGFAPWEKSD